ncbi:MAG: hypothetical protein Q9216_005371 [Gyalolechia sp. 2 TL-2023]
MKTFIISAIIGFTALNFQGVISAAVPKVDAADIKRDTQGHCWEADDGQVHCTGKRDAFPGVDFKVLAGRQMMDRSIALASVMHFPVLAGRQPMDKSIALASVMHFPVSSLAEDGQIYYSIDTYESQGICWEADDGQLHCSAKRDALPEPKKESKGGDNYPSCGAPICKRVTIDKRDASPEPLVLLPPGPIINGTSRQCALWWLVVNLAGQPDPCLSALVAAQNITFAQFRQLNPDIDSTCTNLRVGYAYCIQGVHAFNASLSNATSTQLASSTGSLLLPLRVTQARNATRGHGLPVSTPVSQSRFDPSSTGTVSDTITARPSAPPFASVTGLPSSECTLLTYNFGSETTLYAVDSSLHICQTQILPNGTVYHLPQPETTAAVRSAASPAEASEPTQVADHGRLSSFEPTATG